jgi:hypothetical protein
MKNSISALNEVCVLKFWSSRSQLHSGERKHLTLFHHGLLTRSRIPLESFLKSASRRISERIKYGWEGNVRRSTEIFCKLQIWSGILAKWRCMAWVNLHEIGSYLCELIGVLYYLSYMFFLCCFLRRVGSLFAFYFLLRLHVSDSEAMKFIWCDKIPFITCPHAWVLWVWGYFLVLSSTQTNWCIRQNSSFLSRY